MSMILLMYAYMSYSMLGTGELDRMQAILAKMKETLMPFAVWDQGHYHFLKAWYLMQTGDAMQAESDMTTAVGLVESCGNPFTIALCQILQSQLLLELGDEKNAERLLLSVTRRKKTAKQYAYPFFGQAGSRRLRHRATRRTKCPAASAEGLFHYQSTWPDNAVWPQSPKTRRSLRHGS